MASNLEPHFGPVEIRTLSPMHVAQYSDYSAEPEQRSSEYLSAWIARHGVADPQDRRHFGFDVEVPAAYEAPGVRGYEVWEPVIATAQPSNGVRIADFPGGVYAVMRLFDPFTDAFQVIPAGWNRLLEWSRSPQGRPMTSGPCLEELVPGPEGYYLDLYLHVG